MAKRRKKSKGLTWRGQIVLIFSLLAAVAALPTTVMLFLGMLPTMVCLFIDRTAEKTRVLTVGAMNAAGCSPFIVQLWTTHNTFENSMSITTDPRTVIVMYCAAGVGYMLDWAISGIVATIMVQRAQHRIGLIQKKQEEMVERWGREVTGEIPVDAYGFALESDDDKYPKEQVKTKR